MSKAGGAVGSLTQQSWQRAPVSDRPQRMPEGHWGNKVIKQPTRAVGPWISACA